MQSIIMRALDEIAARGYALDEGERGPAVKCAAGPVRDHTGAVIAAVSISGQPEHVDAIGAERIVAAVRERADAISARLGHVDSWRRCTDFEDQENTYG